MTSTGMNSVLAGDCASPFGTLSTPPKIPQSWSSDRPFTYQKLEDTLPESYSSPMSNNEPQWASRTRAKEVQLDLTSASVGTKHSAESVPGERERPWSPNRALSFTAISSENKGSAYSDLARAGGFRRHYMHVSADATGVDIADRPVYWSEPLQLVKWSDASPYINFGGLRKSERICGDGNSTYGTAVAIFKAMICSGITFTPAATAKCGWAFALVAFPCLAITCVAGVQQLTHCMKLYDSHRSYADLADSAFGQYGRFIVNASIVVSQCAFCSIYLLFVAESMPFILGLRPGTSLFAIVEAATLVLQTAFFVPMSWMQQVRHLNVVNEAGSAGILFGVLIMITLFARQLYDDGMHPEVVPFDASTWPVFLGVAGYTFEGISALLPIYQAMDDNKKHRWPLLFPAVIVLVCFFLTAVGVLGYCAVGPDVQTVALESLPNSWLKTVTQVVYLFALICSFPMQFFPVPVILEAHAPTGTLTKENKRMMRTIVVCAMSLAAYICRKHLGRMVGVVGAVLAVPLMVVLPAAIHLRLRGVNCMVAACVDTLMIMLGVVMTLLCGAVSLSA